MNLFGRSIESKTAIALGAIVLVGSVLGTPACSSKEVSVGADVDNGNLGFADTPDGGDAGEADVTPAPTLMCVSTTCPYPYTTCNTEKAGFQCSVNLLNDPNNCGGCGISCDDYEPIGMKGQCVNGACDFQCLNLPYSQPPQILKNCNGYLDDGCEANLLSDSNNCGACGHKCKAGVFCMDGACGCPAGKTLCDGSCVDLSTDGRNCGACGNECPFEPDNGCEIIDKHASNSCTGGVCGKLACLPSWGDCNGDKATCPAGWDGCETRLLTVDNCGACGNKCAPGQVCLADNTGIHCSDTCDMLGLTDCGTKGEEGGGCRDLNTDVEYCGSCLNACPSPQAHQSRTCRKGACEYPCDEGFADCNGDPSDGCEVDLRSHPANCGACGVQCDLGLGQPCVEGKCLTQPCDADGGFTR